MTDRLPPWCIVDRDGRFLAIQGWSKSRAHAVSFEDAASANKWLSANPRITGGTVVSKPYDAEMEAKERDSLGMRHVPLTTGGQARSDYDPLDAA